MKNVHAKSLPVIMYHYINEYQGAITLSRARFEEHCRVLAENGWRGVGLAEAEGFLIHGEPLPEKSVLFTFDDGFLDNYLYAMPLLHKYGHKGVMFAVSNRVEEGDTPRVPLANVLAGKTPELPEVLRPVGQDGAGHKVRRDVFCNRGEVLAMEANGVMAVASHSRGHYGVNIGPEYTKLLRPGPQMRTFYRTEEPLVWGMPAFTVKYGLVYRAFIPAPELVAAVSALVPQTEAGADAFFAEEANVAELTRLVSEFAKNLGRFETDEEQGARMRREIVQGKIDLETILGHELKTLCWPWGHYSQEALDIGREAGFSLFLTTKEGVNPPGKPLAAHRFKGKDESGEWLLSRSRLYARPWLGALYARLRI